MLAICSLVPLPFLKPLNTSITLSFPHVPCQLISASLKTTAVLVSTNILCLFENTDEWNTITFTILCLPAFHLVMLQKFTRIMC